MPDLVAFGPGGEPRWRRPLPLRPVTLGRVPGFARGPALVGKFGICGPLTGGACAPVVNLAARPESMTRMFGVPVLCDEPTAGGGHTGHPLLRRMPRADGPTRYLKDFMERHHHNPPAGWNGVVVLQAK